MSKWVVRTTVVALVAGGWLALKATVFAERPVAVQVTAAGRGIVESTVTNTRAGTVRVRRRAQLSPEISGLVVEVPAREGDAVEAGAVLVRMDDASQRAQLELARRALEAAIARHDEACIMQARAAREYERYAKVGDDLVSSDRLDALASALEAAEASCRTGAATVAQAQAEVTLWETQLAKTLIRAPFAGVLAEVSVEVGEFVTPSPPGVPIPPVVDLIDPTSIYISAPMDEVDSAAIRAGLPARVTLDPYPGRSFDGTVVRVAPYVLDVELQNRTVEIEVELEDSEFASRLLPGTSADVEVILEVARDVLRIPTATLLEGSHVLVLENGLLVERQVEVGLKNWDWTEVRGGLKEGQEIVTSLGDPGVKAGQRAVVAPPEAP